MTGRLANPKYQNRQLPASVRTEIVPNHVLFIATVMSTWCASDTIGDSYRLVGSLKVPSEHGLSTGVDYNDIVPRRPPSVLPDLWCTQETEAETLRFVRSPSSNHPGMSSLWSRSARR